MALRLSRSYLFGTGNRYTILNCAPIEHGGAVFIIPSMRSDTFSFEIPPEKIAQTPADQRDASRLMVVRRASRSVEHRMFRDLPELLEPDDLLVLNDTRVKPCRLHCRKSETGGHVELFVLKELGEVDGQPEFKALTGSWRNLREGMKLDLPHDGGQAELVKKTGDHWRVRFEMDAEKLDDYIRRAAKMPLPPYIKRHKFDDDHSDLDYNRYQTVFAESEGAVAAPTAGLHFTPEIFDALETRGINRTFLTLHVGPGTFRPIKTETLEQHDMHAEEFTVPEQAVSDIAETRCAGGRVVVVGTTSTRTLETVADDRGLLHACHGESSLFIYPPYRFRCVDVLLTNFHMPNSTLIFLVAAWLGVELTRQAYKEALRNDYRFFSYGDSMLCLP